MINAKNIYFAYEDVNILHNISHKFEKGRIYAIIGPNGSGKTTFLKLLGRLREPAKGKITLDEKPYGEYSRKDFAKCVATLPQSRITPQIAARELTEHGRYPYLDASRRLKDEDKIIVEEALRSTGILHLASRKLTDLSGGERQKVYLSMLYAQKTDYVLLDEPTTYLDISSQFCVMEELVKMKNEGKCVIAVLHDITLALKYADEVILMDKGSIVCSDVPENMAQRSELREILGIRARAVKIDGKTEYVIMKKVKDE